MHNVLLMLVSNTSIITRTFYYLKPGLAVNKKVGKDFFAHLLINRTIIERLFNAIIIY